MRFIALLIAVFVFNPLPAFAQGESGFDYSKEYKIVTELKTALKANDRKTVADLISYPVELPFPLLPIKNSKEFISNWDDFFNKQNVEEILKSKAEPLGDKGLLLDSGIWIIHGKVNPPTTASLENKLMEARKREELNIHSSLHGYKTLIENCDTDKKHIRIQEHDDGYHYFVWSKKTSLLEKPELVLKGDVEHQGTMGGEV